MKIPHCTCGAYPGGACDDANPETCQTARVAQEKEHHSQAEDAGETPARATPEKVALARIREIADFPNTPGGDMLPDLMGRLETIWKIAGGADLTPLRQP